MSFGVEAQMNMVVEGVPSAQHFSCAWTGTRVAIPALPPSMGQGVNRVAVPCQTVSADGHVLKQLKSRQDSAPDVIIM